MHGPSPPQILGAVHPVPLMSPPVRRWQNRVWRTLDNLHWQRHDSLVMHTFIHSFRPFLKRPFKSSTTQRRSRLQHGYYIGVSRRNAQATAGKGLAQGPYMAARAGVEPTTLRLKVIASTNAPPRPTH